MLMKSTFIAAIALAVAGTLGGCGRDDEPKPVSTPTQSASPTTPSTSPSEPGTTAPEPTWDDQYSAAELRRYGDARDRWLAFWNEYNEAARLGVDTPRVKQMFEEYSRAPLGEYSRFLDLYVRGGVRMEVPPEVLWTSASRIGPAAVTFNYCLDDTKSRIVNTNGDVNPKPKLLRRLVTVQMEKTVEGWKQRGFVHQDMERPCGLTAP
jgi:hypothetical protein